MSSHSAQYSTCARLFSEAGFLTNSTIVYSLYIQHALGCFQKRGFSLIQLLCIVCITEITGS